MFIKSMIKIAGSIALVIGLSAIALAQSGPIEGTVKIQAADGTSTPVAGAKVDIYRLDIKGHYDVKTDKQGRYVRVGLPLQGRYLLIASGPGMQPTWINNVRITQTSVVDIVANPGDGSQLTLEQVQAAIAGSGGEQPAAADPGDKAKAEADAKKYEAERKEAEELNASFDKARVRYNQGVEFMKVSNFQGALTEFEAAGGVDTSKHEAFYELAYKSNANLAEAHYQIGVPLFNEKKRDEAKNHFQKAVAAINKAITIAQAAPKPGPNHNNDLITYYNILVKNAKLLVEFYQDTEVIDQTVKAIDKAKTLDTANKTKWEVTKGDLYRAAFRSEEAITAYKEALAADEKNLDALYGLGIALLSTGDESKFQEAANYLGEFANNAPSNDSRAASVKESLDALKAASQVEPEKPANRRRRRP